MSEFKKTEVFLGRFKEYGKDISHEEHQPEATNPPLWRFDTLLKCVKRDKLTQDLFKTIKSADYKYVNLWGIGGVGKSCLVSLCIDQNRDRFGSVLYFPIDHRSIEYDTVDLIKNKAFFSVLKERQNLGDDVERNFDILMTALNEYAQPGKINLLIFDINDKVFEDKDKIQENEDKDTNRKKVDKDKMQEYDDKGKKSFIAKLRRDPYLLPPKWKVLFVSHSMCFNKSINDGNNADSDTVRNCCDILLEDTDKDFARRLFDKLCNKQLNYDDKQREEIIKNLLYHPLLISVLPYVLHTNTNNKRIIKFVKEKSVSMRGHKKDENIAQYLNELVRLDRLSPNQRIIAIMFMLWPTDFIPYKVVCSLLHDYVFEHDKGKGKLHHESDIYKYNLIDFEKKYEVDEQVNASFDTALNQLVDFNILMRSGDSYQMHSMMADVLRGQYYKYIHHWWTKVLRFFGGVVDHTTYVKVSKEVLGNVSDDINRNTYLNCFVNSIPWLHKKDPVCGRMKELASIIQNSQILFFARALEYSQTIEEQKEPEKKIALLYEFGQFYENGIFKTGNETITGYRDTSSALIQYEKAIDIFKENHNLIKNHSTIVNLYLKCAELSQSVNYFETAFAYYQNHKLECKLNERYCKLMELLPDDFDVEVQNDNKRADAYYRLGKFYEDYYWSEHTYWFKKLSKSLLNQADSIWASLPAETEGPLKGFVKTSYGIYDPEFGFKLVKVEKGKFIMGTTPGEELRAKQKLYQIREDEQPAHEVTIEDDFYIGMFPVTKGQWKKCSQHINIPSFEQLESDGIKNTEDSNGNKFTVKVEGKTDNCPINYVSAKDADDFIEQMKQSGRHYSLPTEAQWEFAARGGVVNKVRQIFSGSDNVSDVAVCDKSYKIEGQTVTLLGPDEVGCRKPNELGIYDMSGNVWEWCQDWYHSQWYSNEKGKNGTVCEFKDISSEEFQKFKLSRYWLNGVNVEDLFSKYYHVDAVDGKFPARVLRGGSWYFDAAHCRVSNRDWNNPFIRLNVFGFRLVLSSQKNETNNQK